MRRRIELGTDEQAGLEADRGFDRGISGPAYNRLSGIGLERECAADASHTVDSVATPFGARIPLSSRMNANTIPGHIRVMSFRLGVGSSGPALLMSGLPVFAQRPINRGPRTRIFLSSRRSEKLCRHGHGVLVIPEFQTSWATVQTWQPFETLRTIRA